MTQNERLSELTQTRLRELVRDAEGELSRREAIRQAAYRASDAARHDRNARIMANLFRVAVILAGIAALVWGLK